MELNKSITVEVAYATAEQQIIYKVQVALGSTIADAIAQSDICKTFPEINLAKQKVGVFSKIKDLTDTVAEGDRIEIYRPLRIDPKDARRLKAKKNRKK